MVTLIAKPNASYLLSLDLVATNVFYDIMKFSRHRTFLKALLLIFFAVQAQALEQKILNNTRPYLLPEQTNFFSIEQESTGDLEFENQQLKMSNSKQQMKLHHLKHSPINNETYLIWKFIPVGIGYLFKQNEFEQVSAEWEMKYQPDEQRPGTFKTAYSVNSMIGTYF